MSAFRVRRKIVRLLIHEAFGLTNFSGSGHVLLEKSQYRLGSPGVPHAAHRRFHSIISAIADDHYGFY